jgi:hypothetical protein
MSTFERTRSERCLSDLAMERLLVGELQTEPQRATTLAHLASCARCKHRRDELAAAPAQIPDALWWQRTQPVAKPPTPRRERTFLKAGGGALVLAAAAAFVFVVRPRPPESPTGADTRTKGASLALELVARRTDGRVEPVFAGTALHPDDALRFVLTTAEPSYVAVVGADAGGHVSIYYRSVDVAAAGTHELPGSIILDETLGPERLVALACPEAPDEATLRRVGREAMERLAEPTQPSQPAATGACRQTAVTIRKERAP